MGLNHGERSLDLDHPSPNGCRRIGMEALSRVSDVPSLLIAVNRLQFNRATAIFKMLAER